MITSRSSIPELQQQFEQVLEKAEVIINQAYLDSYETDLREVYAQAMTVIQNAKKLGIALDLTTKSKKHSSHDINILCLVLAVNDLSQIDELLANDFNPNRYQYNSEYPFSKITSYEAVQLLLKHGVLQKIKEQSPRLFDSLKQSSAFITLADIRELNPPVPEQEYKELPLAKSFWSKKVVEFNQDSSSRDIVDQACLGIYNLGVKMINKDKKLLANYNLLPETYSKCADEHRSDLAQHLAEYNKPYMGQLKTLYVLRIGLDTLKPEVVWELRKKARVLDYDTNDMNPICYPTGAKFFSFEAIKEFLELYISNNPKRFDPIGNKNLGEYERIQLDWSLRFRPRKLGIGEFTGFIPGFGFINSDNILKIYHAVVANEPEIDIFKLLLDEKMKQQAASSVTHEVHLFAKKLVRPFIGLFSLKATEKPQQLEFEEKKSALDAQKESKHFQSSSMASASLDETSARDIYQDRAPGGPSFR
ncbi:MAG: hypothetical protein ACYCQI_08880 [Gammaproteobacteria bacterium]